MTITLVTRTAGTLLALTCISTLAAPLQPQPSTTTHYRHASHAPATRQQTHPTLTEAHPSRATRATHRTPTLARALTMRYALSHNYTPHQTRCLLTLWQRESNFRPQALNRRSGAGGIPQLLGLNPATPTSRQIERGLAYITHRYGTPCHALHHHNRRGWY